MRREQAEPNFVNEFMISLLATESNEYYLLRVQKKKKNTLSILFYFRGQLMYLDGYQAFIK